MTDLFVCLSSLDTTCLEVVAPIARCAPVGARHFFFSIACLLFPFSSFSLRSLLSFFLYRTLHPSQIPAERPEHSKRKTKRNAFSPVYFPLFCVLFFEKSMTYWFLHFRAHRMFSKLNYTMEEKKPYFGEEPKKAPQFARLQGGMRGLTDLPPHNGASTSAAGNTAFSRQVTIVYSISNYHNLFSRTLSRSRLLTNNETVNDME